MRKDPWQMHNLAADPGHQEALKRMRAACEGWMLENHDLGLLSQYELYLRSAADSPLQMGADPKRNPLPRLLEAANEANRRDPATLPLLLNLLKDEDSAVRRWGAIGLLALRDQAAPAARALRSALEDSSPDVRLTAAEALFGLGEGEVATPVLIRLLTHESRIIRNETLLALCRLGPPARAALPHLDSALPPSKHSDLWSYDDVKAAVSLARSCLSPDVGPGGIELPPSSTHPVPASARLRLTRQRYLP